MVLTSTSVNGHRALRLENEQLVVVVLPDKGADITEIRYKPGDVQFLMHTPMGLRPPGDRPPADFLENYEGGWQELFPNAGEEAVSRGVTVPFHGEVALLPWKVSVLQNDSEETSVLFIVRSRLLPLRLERRVRLCRGQAVLAIEETVHNESASHVSLMWGHHLVLGGSFLGEGCTLAACAGTILTPDELYEPRTARLAPGQREPWPFARGRTGERVDLRWIPSRAVHSHDDVVLTDLTVGRAMVANPRLGLSFQLNWDRQLFPYLVVWLPFGGADMPPLTGIYGLGIEPWASRYNLEEAIRHGEAIGLAGGASRETTLRVEIGRVQQGV